MSASKEAIAGALMNIWHRDTGAPGRIARALYGWMTADDLDPGYVAWGMVDDSLRAMGLHWAQTQPAPDGGISKQDLAQAAMGFVGDIHGYPAREPKSYRARIALRLGYLLLHEDEPADVVVRDTIEDILSALGLDRAEDVEEDKHDGTNES